MKRKSFLISLWLLAAFVLWTMAVRFIDVQAIGPEGSHVGFAGINGYFHRLTGVHWGLYHITDWLGLVPIFVCMGFGALGVCQWIRRKSIRKVDWDILALGGFYVVTIGTYLLFEYVVINRRPVLIEGILEASYPSSTTMLTLCVMPTAVMQLRSRIANRSLRKVVSFIIVAFTAFMVIGRLISGVHWLTDIVGGGLLSAGLVMLYDAASGQ